MTESKRLNINQKYQPNRQIINEKKKKKKEGFC